MSVRIDESGNDVAACQVDHARTLGVRQIMNTADRCDPSILDHNHRLLSITITAFWRGAAPVPSMIVAPLSTVIATSGGWLQPARTNNRASPVRVCLFIHPSLVAEQPDIS